MKKILIVRRVYGHSMTPTLIPGQLIFATGLLKPKVGDIVIAKQDSREVVKRIELIANNKAKLTGDNPHELHNTVVSLQQIQATKLL